MVEPVETHVAAPGLRPDTLDYVQQISQVDFLGGTMKDQLQATNRVTVLNAAGRFSPEFAQELETVIQRHVDLIGADLSLAGVDVVVTTGYTGLAIEELAVGGYAPSAEFVAIAVEPDNPEFVHWRDRIPATVAHELNHAARWRTPGYGRTLLECLVSEGLAVAYETELFGKEPPYSHPCGDLQEFWEAAQPLLDRTDYNHARWFFGNGDLPRWTGYALGYELVQRFVAAENMTVREATGLHATDFLRHSRSAVAV